MLIGKRFIRLWQRLFFSIHKMTFSAFFGIVIFFLRAAFYKGCLQSLNRLMDVFIDSLALLFGLAACQCIFRFFLKCSHQLINIRISSPRCILLFAALLVIGDQCCTCQHAKNSSCCKNQKILPNTVLHLKNLPRTIFTD